MIAAILMVAVASVPVLEIVSPSAGEPAFGRVLVVVRASAPSEIERIELFVDDSSVGAVTRAPFQFSVELGSDNVVHSFRAVARCLSGQRVTAELTTPAIQVDAHLGFELQQLYVTASHGGRALLDLTRGEFEISDDGARQEVASFARGDIPFTACILLDASASMAGEKLRAAFAGASSFAADLRPLDESRLLVFSDRLLTQSGFVGAREGFSGVLEGVVAGGGTALNDVLFLALRLLESRQGRRVVIILSDGADSLSVLNIEDVLEQARRTRAIVYWFRLVSGTTDDRPELHRSTWRNGAGFVAQAKGLEKIVADSGGATVRVSSPEAMAPAFRDVLRELREQYVLGYYPTTARNDGAWHRVVVDVRRRAVRVRTSAGYVDY